MENGKIENNLNDLIEIVSYIKDNMATKHELAEVKADIVGIKGDIVEIKADIVEIKADIVEIKASMVSLEKRIENLEREVSGFGVRFAFMAKEIETIKITLLAIDKRTSEDDRMIINDVNDLKARITSFDERLKILEAQRT